jgi:hypothetical protein
MKDKLSDHMDKIDKAQKEIEAQLEVKYNFKSVQSHRILFHTPKK